MGRRRSIGWLGLLAIVLVGCGASGPSPEAVTGEGGDTPTLELRSPAFSEGEGIPDVYTCAGEDVSPPLTWGEVPAGTESLALLMDDPDAPGRRWVHWVIYSIPPSSRSLPERVPVGASLEEGVRQGKNSWSKHAYGGPCPPSGTHRYFFYLYALDTTLDWLPDDTNKADLLEAVDGHVLAWGRLMGRYQR